MFKKSLNSEKIFDNGNLNNPKPRAFLKRYVLINLIDFFTIIYKPCYLLLQKAFLLKVIIMFELIVLNDFLENMLAFCFRFLSRRDKKLWHRKTASIFF